MAFPVSVLKKNMSVLFLGICICSCWFAIPSSQVYSVPPFNMLKAPYHVQEGNYNCGPACVQMALEYISGYLVSQDVLATEMMTGAERGGTDLNMLRVPFVKRGYTSLDEHQQATVAELKEHNSLGHVAIINIHFDTLHKAGHYVLVVGYNSEGIFVNDPWPNTVTIDGRRTGKEAFISYLLLSDLWSRRNNWVLRIYPMKGSESTSTSRLTFSYFTVSSSEKISRAESTLSSATSELTTPTQMRNIVIPLSVAAMCVVILVIALQKKRVAVERPSAPPCVPQAPTYIPPAYAGPPPRAVTAAFGPTVEGLGRGTVCFGCGATVPAGSVFCQQCGKTITSES